MGFIPHTYKDGQPTPWEYLTAPAGMVLEIGTALVAEEGELSLATGTVTPQYISMYQGTAKDGDLIPVIRALEETVFETTFSVAAEDVEIGMKLTISADGTQVTATTGGAAEVVSIPEGKEADDVVRVRLV